MYRLHQIIVTAAILTGLLACGDSPAPTTTTSPDATRTVSGQVAKGPLKGATVELFDIDRRGTPTGQALATVMTDDQGNWTATIPAGANAVLVSSSGGRYIDEADPEPNPLLRRSVVLGTDDRFSALLPAGAGSVALNIYTDALLRKSQAQTQGENFVDVFERNRELLVQAFGFDVATTLPADPIMPSALASRQQLQYAMALGGIANVVNAYAIARQQTIADFDVIETVIDDMTDCRIDGHGTNGRVAGPLPQFIGLNSQILRFRNNNLPAYESVTLLQLDQQQCSMAGGLPDQIAPVLHDVPADYTVGALSARGIDGTAPAVREPLSMVRATDDRDGPIDVVFDLPNWLPLGVTVVSATATDAAGNTAETLVTITVADLDPPRIEAPADIDVMATGELTQVDPGAPIFSDNVSSNQDLVLLNDLPAAGLAPGLHIVTWTVTDAAGLSASGTQQIIVRTVPPVLQTPLADQTATEGLEFSLATASAFSDIDSILRYSLAGLPVGTGLQFDALSGTLSGIPNDADAQASPVLLVVSAQDELSTIEDDFVLTIIDVNNPPRFSVETITLDEDFATTSFSVIPDPVPAGDPNDVTYSVTSTLPFVNVEVDADSGRLTVTSIADQNGQGSFTMTADDGADVNSTFTTTVSVQVNPVNDPPVFELSGNITVVRGFNGIARVTALPGPVPADELGDAVSYSLQHNVDFARISIDPLTGEVSVADVADTPATALISVVADDGKQDNNRHSELLTLTVGETDKLFYALEPVDTYLLVPVFPDAAEVPATYSVLNLPRSLVLDTFTGRITGTPTRQDVAIGIFEVQLTVVSNQGRIATFPMVLRIIERDSDDDGLPDDDELVQGTDPAMQDTDGDGVGDGLEVQTGSNPLVPAAAVIYLDSQHDLSAFAPGPGLSADRPVFVLLQPGVYGALNMTGACDHVVIIGGMPAGTTGMPDLAQRSLFVGAPITIEGCSGAGLHYVSVTDNIETALSVTDADLAISNIALYLNNSVAFSLVNADVELTDSVLGGDTTTRVITMTGSDLRFANGSVEQRGDGGVYLVSIDSELDLEHVITRSPAGDIRSDRPPPRARLATPNLARLQYQDGHYLARLYAHGVPLSRGYGVIDGEGNRWYDINHGAYVWPGPELPPDLIMLTVNRQTLPIEFTTPPR